MPILIKAKKERVHSKYFYCIKEDFIVAGKTLKFIHHLKINWKCLYFDFFFFFGSIILLSQYQIRFGTYSYFLFQKKSFLKKVFFCGHHLNIFLPWNKKNLQQYNSVYEMRVAFLIQCGLILQTYKLVIWS